MKNTLISIAVIIGIFAGGFISGRYFTKEKIKIVKEIEYKTQYKTEYKYLQTAPDSPDNFRSLQMAFNTPIGIKGEIYNEKWFIFNDTWLKTTASDTFKSSQKDFQINATRDWRFYLIPAVIGLGAGAYITYRLKK